MNEEKHEKNQVSEFLKNILYWITFPFQYISCKRMVNSLTDEEKREMLENNEKYLKPLKTYRARHNYKYIKKILSENL